MKTMLGDLLSLAIDGRFDVIVHGCNCQCTMGAGIAQYHWRGAGVLVEYEAVRSAFRQIRDQFKGRRLGYPMIGAGLAKGDWSIISQIIQEELDGEDHTLVEYRR